MVHHTRSGKGPHQIKGNAAKRRRSKQDIFTRALSRAAAIASRPGIVVGDLNLTKSEVDSALHGAAHERENIRHWGGEGRFEQ